MSVRVRSLEWSPTKRITVAILLLTLVLLVAWDIIAATNEVQGDTISEILLEAGLRHPFVMFVAGLGFGVVLGHLFWMQRVDENGNVL